MDDSEYLEDERSENESNYPTYHDTNATDHKYHVSWTVDVDLTCSKMYGTPENLSTNAVYSDVCEKLECESIAKINDWSEETDSAGKKYYRHCKTGVSQWEKPLEWIKKEIPEQFLNEAFEEHSTNCSNLAVNNYLDDQKYPHFRETRNNNRASWNSENCNVWLKVEPNADHRIHDNSPNVSDAVICDSLTEDVEISKEISLLKSEPFTTSTSAENHQLMDVPIPQSSVGYSGPTVVSSCSLKPKLKKRSHTKVRCSVCGIQFTLKCNFLRHFRHCHVKKIKDNKLECATCFKKFARKHRLGVHIFANHATFDETNEESTCLMCQKSFPRHRDLVHHQNQIYFADFKTKYECKECQRTFTRKKELKSHFFKEHMNTETNFICVLCGKSFQTRCCILHHLEEVHRISFEIERHSFKNNFDFTHWKAGLEKMYHTTYVKETKYYAAKMDVVKEAYRCNRSGPSHPSPISEGGSGKTNEFCPSRINVANGANGSREVTFTKTHIGHRVDFTPLSPKRRSKEAKKAIVSKIHNEVPATCIVDDKNYDRRAKGIRPTSTTANRKINGNIARNKKRAIVDKIVNKVPTISLINDKNNDCWVKDVRPPSKIANRETNERLTRNKSKAILNEILDSTSAASVINGKNNERRAKGSGPRSKTDSSNGKNDGTTARNDDSNFINVDPNLDEYRLGIQTWVASNLDSVLYYKYSGDRDASGNLRDNDFVVVIMKSEQEIMLRRHGNSVILMDGTHCTYRKRDVFLLRSILILDEAGEGYPCCFMLTNRDDQRPCDLMIACVKERVGRISPSTFISNMQCVYLASWISVMGSMPQFYLHCTWHVERIWEKKLPKSPAKERKNMKYQLEQLIRIENVDVFRNRLEKFCSRTNAFVKYFVAEFKENHPQWATCFRQHAGVHPKMNTQRFHDVFKELYDRGLRVEQVADTLRLIDHYLRGRKSDACRAQIRSDFEIRSLKKAHDEAKSYLLDSDDKRLNATSIDENSWAVPSFTKHDAIYTVIMRKKDACPSNCCVKCEECFFCAHQFSCTCPGHAAFAIMCKHIHAICLEKLLDVEEVSFDVPNNLTDTTLQPVFEEYILPVSYDEGEYIIGI